MSHYKQDLFISWEEFHILSEELAAMLVANQVPVDGIIAIARGGLFPATMLARILGIPLIDTVCIQSYDKQGQKNPELLKFSQLYVNKQMLVVDDLGDTGGTLSLLREYMPKVNVATLIVKPKAKPFTNYFCKEVPQETWVHFPWEMDSTQTQSHELEINRQVA